MKKILPLLLAALCLLTGCSSKYSGLFEKLRTDTADSTALSFNADIRAEYDDRTERFSLACTRSAGETCVTVTRPESIAGVRARCADGGLKLEYGAVSMDLGVTDEKTGLTPAAAPAILTDAIINGFLTACGRDGDTVLCSVAYNDDISVQLWLSGTEGVPVRAEIVSGGRVTVFCDISDWKTE